MHDDPLGESLRDLARPPRNAWLAPVGRYVFSRWVQCGIIMFLIVAFAASCAIARAEADDGDLTAPTIIIQHRQIVELEKRIQDLEVNMQAQIAKPCACAAPTATVNESEQNHRRCVTRFSKQLAGTNATAEQYDRAVAHCDLQWSIWRKRDP